MRRIAMAMLLALLLVPPAAAAEFPLDKSFKAISISGFDVQKAGITVTVARNRDGFRGSGNAGCNNWTATAMIREDQIEFAEIVATKKSCGGPRMKTEEAFLASLRTAQRWRIDDKNRLIIEGETARLLLTSAGASR
jgi:heat shock protein HslJ